MFADDPLRGVGPCFGDSGGPLTVRGNFGKIVQVGVTSFGAESFFVGGRCAFRWIPDVFTRVAGYKEWIEEVTGSSAKFVELS